MAVMGPLMESLSSRRGRQARVQVAVAVLLTAVSAWGAGAASAATRPFSSAAPGAKVSAPGQPSPKAGRKNDQKKRKSQNRAQTAAFQAAATRMSQSGVTCEDGAGEDAIEACAGKNAGDPCTVERDEHSFTGVCGMVPGDLLACQPPPPPPPSQDAIDACADKAPGDACTLPGEDASTPGLCKSFSSGVVACVKAPMRLQDAIDACAGKALGDSCSIARHDDDDDDDDHGEDDLRPGGALYHDDDDDDDDDVFVGACASVPELGAVLVCLPRPRVPRAVAACDGKLAGDTCSFEHDDRTVTGQCVMPSGQTSLVCQPAPETNPCSGRNEGDACTLVHDDRSIDGTCVAVPFGGGGLVCIPQQLIPPPVSACSGKAAGDICSFTHDGRTIDGNCAAVFGLDLLVCVPPPPQGLIDACVGKVAGDACSASLRDHEFTGACATAPDGVTLICLPRRHDDDDDVSPREAACEGLPEGALCTVTFEDRTQNGTCRRDDDDDDRPECVPPAPPQEAIDACTGLMDGDTCSFTFRDHTVSGACRALPGAATLVCAPLCPHPRKDRDD